MAGGFQALKPCRFSGKDYVPGDFIPEDAILPASVPLMTRMGYIAPAQPVQPDGDTFPAIDKQDEIEDGGVLIPIMRDDGIAAVTIPAVELYKVLEILQTKIADSIEMIPDIKNLEALELLKRLETRKTFFTTVGEAIEKMKAEMAAAQAPATDAQDPAGGQQQPPAPATDNKPPQEPEPDAGGDGN